MNTDSEGFAALVKEVERRVTVLTPIMAERLGELWDEYPTLEAHKHALAQTDMHAAGFNLRYYESCLSSWQAKQKLSGVISATKGIAELHAVRVSEGATSTDTTKELEDMGLRVQLNRLLGLPERNYTPAFRIGLEQVELACALLFRAKRQADQTEARWLRYQAERVIYPHQSCDGMKEGLLGIFKEGYAVLKAAGEA